MRYPDYLLVDCVRRSSGDGQYRARSPMIVVVPALSMPALNLSKQSNGAGERITLACFHFRQIVGCAKMLSFEFDFDSR
jgi:hypothetical protein